MGNRKSKVVYTVEEVKSQFPKELYSIIMGYLGIFCERALANDYEVVNYIWLQNWDPYYKTPRFYWYEARSQEILQYQVIEKLSSGSNKVRPMLEFLCDKFGLEFNSSRRCTILKFYLREDTLWDQCPNIIKLLKTQYDISVGQQKWNY